MGYMTPDFTARLLNNWNKDPLFERTLRGRKLSVEQGEKSIVVSWTDGASLRIYPMSYQRAAEEGWGDMLTELIEILDKPEPS